MSNNSKIRIVDITMHAQGKTHLLRFEDADDIADLCALISHLRSREAVSCEHAAAKPAVQSEIRLLRLPN